MFVCVCVCLPAAVVSMCTCCVCVNGNCVCVLQLSYAADMWLIRCHQCVFETGCFIHSHPIAYIFDSSPRERRRGRAKRERRGGKGKKRDSEGMIPE